MLDGHRIFDGLHDFYHGDIEGRSVAVVVMVSGQACQFKAMLHRGRGGYGVSFPDAPDLMAIGSTVAVAVQNGRRALASLLR